jgi:hypothetical protein
MVETTIGTSQLGSPILAEIRDYAEMHAVMRERAETLEVSRATIDHVAGLENGYAAKLLQPEPSKRLGPVSWSMLRVLGIKLLAVVDVEARAALAHRLTRRDSKHARNGAPVNERPPSVEEMAQALVRMRMSENGRRGGHARAESLPAKHRANIARKAARARWQTRG